MVKDGYIEVSIYKRSIEMFISANYSNSLGKNDWIIKYVRIEYGNRIWRWFFESDAIRQIGDIGLVLGMPVRAIRNFRSISGETGYKTTIPVEIIDL